MLPKNPLTLIEHDSIKEIEKAYTAEYVMKADGNLIGFYSVKSNMIHTLSKNVMWRYVFEHEYAHYGQRSSFRMKYNITIGQHITTLFGVGLGVLLGGLGIGIFLQNIITVVLALVAGIVLLTLAGLCASFCLSLENEASQIARREMELKGA